MMMMMMMMINGNKDAIVGIWDVLSWWLQRQGRCHDNGLRSLQFASDDGAVSDAVGIHRLTVNI